MSSFGYDLLGFGSSANTEIAVEPDDEFNRVSFLSHFDGANNGVNNAFDDGSADNLTISTAGNVTQGSFSPFFKEAGNWSVDFSGISSPLIRFDSDSNMGAGTGAYTVEAWVNWSNWAGTNQRIWLQGVAGTDGIVLGKDSGANTLFTKGGAINYSFTPTLGRWYHIAVVRADTNTNGESLYIDGTRVAQGTQSGSVAANQFIVSGLNWAGNYNVQGKVSNFRYTKAAVYSGSSFTPIEEPLSAITYTEILTCQDHKFIDNSARARPILQNNYDNGKAIISGLGPFLTDAAYDPAVNGASAYFDTTHTGAILVASPPAMTSTFTYECWVYPIGNGTYKPLLNQGPRNGSSVSAFYIGANTKLVLQIADSNAANKIVIAGSANDITLGQWNHVVLTHLYASSTNSTYKIYSNGIEKSSLIHTGGFSWATGAGSGQPLVIGRDEFEGEYGDEMFVQDARLVVGSLVYTGNFTPPTAPLTAITNTKLLLNMADGQIIDIAQPNNMVLYNNAKLSTAQAKFGDTSLLLPGTTGNGSVGGGSIQLEKRGSLSGPFTIETWAWADDTTNAFMFCQGQYRIELGINGNTLRMYKTSSITGDGYINFFTGGEFSVNTWHHVALVRDTSNVIKCYLNGTASGTTLTDATAFPASDGVFSIGSEYHSTSPNRWHGWDGYLDEFRISEFARYTNNFTPPTKPFADKGQ